MNKASKNGYASAENTYLQVEELKAELASFKGKVSGEQKMQIALELGVSSVTIERYLRGELGKKPFARKLIDALKNIVQTAC